MLSQFSNQASQFNAAILAHAGHGHTGSDNGSSLWHYISEPQHAWVFAGAITMLTAAILWKRLMRESEQSASE